ASTGAMLFTGHKGTSGKSALARRTESSTRVANTAVRRQVSGTSDCTSRRDQLLFIELFENWRGSICVLAFLSNNRIVPGAPMTE
ncbi:MAG: hypothetical protein DMG96_14385, partial [Acidobacteria bacterium]